MKAKKFYYVIISDTADSVNIVINVIDLFIPDFVNFDLNSGWQCSFVAAQYVVKAIMNNFTILIQN